MSQEKKGLEEECKSLVELLRKIKKEMQVLKGRENDILNGYDKSRNAFEEL